MNQIETFESGILTDTLYIFDTLEKVKTKAFYKSGKCLNYQQFDTLGNESYYFEYIDTSLKFKYEDFNINFKFQTDTFKAGDTTHINIEHDEISKYQIQPYFTNGILYKTKDKNSFIYHFIPKRKGKTYMSIFVQYSDSISKLATTKEYRVE